MQRQSVHINSLELPSPVLLAPMAGITDLPYRRVMKEEGAGLVFTEMISANGLIRDGKKTRLLLNTHKDEFPLGVQLFGDDPQVLSEATRLISESGELVDINMGCPVKKVVRNGAGSALLQTPAKVGKIIRAVRRNCPVPLTIKIRSGWDEDSINYLEIGKIAQDEGVDAITLHPRTRSQGFSGHSNWSHLAQLKKSLNIPVFGSGDIFTAEDGLKMIEQTGCDAIMIGRGGYGNPWIISQIISLLRGQEKQPPTVEQILQTALRHLTLHKEQFGQRKTVLEMRKHLCWYARGLAGASHFRAALQKTTTIDALEGMTQDFFTGACLR